MKGECNCVFCQYRGECNTPPCLLYAERHGMMNRYEKDRKPKEATK